MGINDLCDEVNEQHGLFLVKNETVCTLLVWTFEQVTVVGKNNFDQAASYEALCGAGMSGAASTICQGRYPQLPIYIGPPGSTDTVNQDQP
jgi:hypothetical protein